MAGNILPGASGPGQMLHSAGALAGPVGVRRLGPNGGLSMPCASTFLSLEPPLWDPVRNGCHPGPQGEQQRRKKPLGGGHPGP